MYLHHKKGLFLAEILLAVVIASVIMGTGYLLYADIQKENLKNKFALDLESLTIQLNQFYGEEPVIFSEPAGSFDDNAFLISSKTIPSTMDTEGTDLIKSAFGFDVNIGPAQTTTSTYFIRTFLPAAECAAVLQHVIKTRPIAFASISGGAVKEFRCVDNSDTKRTLTKQICLETAAKSVTDLVIPIYSPKGEDWRTCKSRI